MDATTKPHPKEWFWLRDELACHIEKDPEGSTYTEQQIMAASTIKSWGAGSRLRPVSVEARAKAYSSLFAPLADERHPVLELVSGIITRTAQRPTYSD